MRNMFPKHQDSSSESDAETHEEFTVQVEKRSQVNRDKLFSPVTD